MMHNMLRELQEQADNLGEEFIENFREEILEMLQTGSAVFVLRDSENDMQIPMLVSITAEPA